MTAIAEVKSGGGPLLGLRAVMISLLVGAALLVAPGAPPAQAQAPSARAPSARAASAQPRSIEPGTSIESAIGVDDRQERGQHYEEYRLELTEGQRVQIDMDAIEPTPRFDTYLTLLGPDGDQPLMGNDDRRDGTLNSRLIFVAPAPGVYRVRAQGFFGQVGSYRLSVARLEAPPAAERIVPSRLTRTFGPSNPIGEMSGVAARYAEFVFAGNENDRVRLELISGIGDAGLRLYDRAGAQIAVGTPSGRSANPTILVALPRTEDYRVWVGVRGDQSGEYHLDLQKAAVAVGPELVPVLRRGVQTPGALALASAPQMSAALNSDLSRLNLYRLYALRVTSGETVTVTLSSNSFVPALDAGAQSMLGFATAVSAEGFGDNVASLVLRPDRSGFLILRVRSIDPGTGEFQLMVEQAAQASPAE